MHGLMTSATLPVEWVERITDIANSTAIFLRPAALLNPLIQRLQHAGIHRGDDIDRRVQLFFAHSRFACIRKAPVDSRIAETHHRDRESDQHFLTIRKTLDGVRFPIKSSKVCFFHSKSPVGSYPDGTYKTRLVGSASTPAL
jgi:hypothetical protein